MFKCSDGWGRWCSQSGGSNHMQQLKSACISAAVLHMVFSVCLRFCHAGVPQVKCAQALDSLAEEEHKHPDGADKGAVCNLPKPGRCVAEDDEVCEGP